MIKTIKGNLLFLLDNNEIDFIFHCCNDKAIMGAGLAKQLVEFWPKVGVADRAAAKNFSNFQGNYSCAEVKQGKFVYNLYGQTLGNEDGRNVNYETLYKATDLGLKSVSRYAETHGKQRVGLPLRMGSDLAGGDWRIVCAIIEVLAEKYDKNIDIIIVRWDKSIYSS